ncbi:hypothetical protein C1645_215193 [Glomus cerebriforme]|uniref:WD40-repeat-containing domain protein n=1 Tax=Glomus cerebriforme TaxID=658196 RepID=A0A397T1K0_9GLOM|nr:hypothetical protein C1645_215193 [Glomus cerebriforme]
MSHSSEIIDIENDDIEKNIATDTEKNNIPHNGKPITIIEVSPKGTYLVTYSPEHNTIIGWNVENVKDKDEVQLKPDYCYTFDHNLIGVIQNICVSDDKKLAYIYNYYIKIIDMNNGGQEIKLNLDLCYYKHNYNHYYYCTFNLRGEFIVRKRIYDQSYNPRIIWIYSTQTKNNKWMCKGIYEIPKGYEMISISKYNKLYLLFSNNHIYEWDLLTEKSIKMFSNEEKIEVIKLFI